MNTTYDEIWLTFLNNCKVTDIDLPQTNEKRYDAIKNAVLHFNNRLRDNLACDNSTETVSRKLNEDHLLILAHYIRLILLINQRTYFENLWQPFQHDVGLKNFQSQLNSLKDSVTQERNTIESLIFNSMEDFL